MPAMAALGGKRGAPLRDKPCTSKARSVPGTSDKVGARAGGPRAQRAGVGLPERSQNGEACGGSHDEARKLASHSLPHSFITRSLTSQCLRSVEGGTEVVLALGPSPPTTHPPLPAPCRDWEAPPCMAEFAALIPTVGMIRALCPEIAPAEPWGLDCGTLIGCFFLDG